MQDPFNMFLRNTIAQTWLKLLFAMARPIYCHNWWRTSIFSCWWMGLVGTICWINTESSLPLRSWPVQISSYWSLRNPLWFLRSSLITRCIPLRLIHTSRCQTLMGSLQISILLHRPIVRPHSLYVISTKSIRVTDNVDFSTQPVEQLHALDIGMNTTLHEISKTKINPTHPTLFVDTSTSVIYKLKKCC